MIRRRNGSVEAYGCSPELLRDVATLRGDDSHISSTTSNCIPAVDAHWTQFAGAGRRHLACAVLSGSHVACHSFSRARHALPESRSAAGRGPIWDFSRQPPRPARRRTVHVRRLGADPVAEASSLAPSATEREPRPMSSRSSSCPNCGAPVAFRWSGSVQTVCEHCRAVLVRTDLDLQERGAGGGPAGGRLADPAADRRAATATADSRSAAASSINTIRAAGTSGNSCSTAAKTPGCRTRRTRLAVSVSASTCPGSLQPSRLRWGAPSPGMASVFVVTSRTLAHCQAGVEGELRIPMLGQDRRHLHRLCGRNEWTSRPSITADRSAGAAAIGQTVDFDALRLRNVRQIRRLVDGDRTSAGGRRVAVRDRSTVLPAER